MQLNLDDTGGARELALHRLKTAKEDLEAAQLNFANGQYRASNNRAYYAIFRAISACLALEFKAYKQHAQVLGNFNKDFVHTGIFPKEISYGSGNFDPKYLEQRIVELLDEEDFSNQNGTNSI